VPDETRRRQRHLIDFDNPRPRPAPSSGMSLTQVQRWVMSVLAFVTIEHLAAGIAVAAIFTDERHVTARVGLNVMAAVTGVLAVGLFRAIHAKPMLSPWLLVGLLPGLVGAWFTFGH
jgi:hypothetical protein